MLVKVSSGYYNVLASCTLVLLRVVPNLDPLPLAAAAPLPLVAAAPLALPLPSIRTAMPSVVVIVNGSLDARMLSMYDATNADSSGNGSSS
jgi:hypothetical protein